MSTMEVKGLHHSAMSRREAEIHPHIQSVANDSCLNSLEEEADSIRPNEAATSESRSDMGWQKRGSGRTYDSKSGVGPWIGNNTGKICAFGVRQSDCRICNRLHVSKENVPPHKCSKNWSGSARAMEPDVGINLIKRVEDQGVKVSTIIMDDDTTTMARIRSELDHSISKWSDVNHTSKHLTNSLFTLQKKHKVLSNNVIAYLKKCFNYALAQTKGDSDSCKAQIEQIVPHAFGEHSMCGDWCRFKDDPENYTHNTLTKDLSGDELRKDLEAVFHLFSQNSEKIAPGGSTREVESFNNMVASKAPKRCHFSASSNLLSRVGCAVAQKNIGNSYISKINESHITRDKANPNKLYFSAERRIRVIRAGLRTKCSSLHQHLYFRNLIDSPLCACGEIESNQHYFFDCRYFREFRKISLFQRVLEIYNVSLQTLLFGDETFSLADNEKIFSAVHSYIIDTNRFRS